MGLSLRYRYPMQTKKALETLKKHLAHYGLNAHLYSSSHFFEQQEVIDLYNLVKGLTNPGDELAWIGVLQSPIMGIGNEGLLYLEQAFPSPEIMGQTTASDSDSH